MSTNQHDGYAPNDITIEPPETAPQAPPSLAMQQDSDQIMTSSTNAVTTANAASSMYETPMQPPSNIESAPSRTPNRTAVATPSANGSQTLSFQGQPTWPDGSPLPHSHLPPGAIIPSAPHGSPTRVYINQKVTPWLLEGVKYLAVNEPEKPLKWLGEYLIRMSEEVEGT